MKEVHTTSPAAWTEIITPRVSLLDVRLKDIWKYKDLLFLFVKRDFAAQYKQTVLGPLWHVIQPVCTTIIFYMIFHRVAKISTNAIPPVLFYMSSLTIWNYFSACLTNTSNTFVANAGIFGKVYFPRLVLPLSSIVSNLARFAIQFGILLVMMLYYQLSGKFSISIGLHTLLIPVISIIMAAMGLGVGIIISSLTTKYRDFSVLVGFGVQLLMYATPVAYPLSYIDKSGFKTFIELNPLSSLVEGFRYAIFGISAFPSHLFLYSLIFTIVVLFAGVIVFSKVERSFMDTV